VQKHRDAGTDGKSKRASILLVPLTRLLFGAPAFSWLEILVLPKVSCVIDCDMIQQCSARYDWGAAP